jgi:hypothetical protein
LLHFLLLAAYWFAPALIVFNKVSVANSLFISLIACKRNLLPILTYGLALTALSLSLLILSNGLGSLLPISVEVAISFSVFVAIAFVTPIIFISSYISYREIFSSDTISTSESESA